MEQRKLIKLGNSSFAIALPKEWVDKSGLKKGDDIFIERNSNGEIIISSKFNTDNYTKEILLNADGKNDEEIAREIISAYTGGCSSIRATGKKQALAIVKEKAKNFLNLEVIEENEKEAILKDLLDIENINLENFVRRMDNNIKEMFSVLIETVKGKNKIKNCLEELDKIDKDVTKFYFLVWRFMNIGLDNPGLQNSLKINSKGFLFYFWITYNMEQIGDDLRRIARHTKNNLVGNDYFAEVIGAALERYNQSMKSFFDKNKELAKESLLKKGDFIKMCEKLSEIEGFSGVSERLQTISSNIHNNSKMIFYNS